MGLLLPLSGPSAALGRDLLDAAQLALFEAGPNEVVLLPRDTRGTPEGARAAMRALLEREVDFVIGPLFARSTRAVAALARERGVPLLSLSNDARVAGPGVFVFGFRPEEQVERVVGFAAAQGYRRIAGLFPRDDYGRRSFEAWQRTAAALGLDAELALFYEGEETEVAEALRAFTAYEARRAALEEQREALRLRGDAAARRALAALSGQETFGPPPFDAVLIADGGLRLRAVTALLAFYDVPASEVRYLGTMRWLLEDPELAQRPDFRGSWIAARDPAAERTFQERFREFYDRNPDPLAPLAYDAVSLAVLLAAQTPPFDLGMLTSPRGFVGYSGILRLRPDGLAEHGLVVLEVGEGELTVRDPAPQSFPAEATRASASLR